MHSILGSAIVDKQGRAMPPGVLSNKIVGLYFSAHWCPPCRAFTPQLVAAYAKTDRSAFEIVFVSSDRDPRSYMEYYGSMPWLAVPFGAAGTKSALSTTYAVRGIPALLLFDPAGKLMVREGVRLVTSGGLGTMLARAPRRSFADTLAALGVTAPRVLLYFGTGKDGLNVLLQRWVGAHPDTAGVVYVSSGGSGGSGAGSMWPTITGAEAAALEDAHGVSSPRPALILVDASGATLCRNAAMRLETEPDSFPWTPRPCENLATVVDDINEVPTLVLFLDKLTDDVLAAQLERAFREAAATAWGAPGAPRFALTSDADEATERLRLHAGLARDRDGPVSYRLAYFQLSAGKTIVWRRDAHPDAAALLDFIVCGV
jgi:thiol-disulfide isomerase/thioredoxin